MESLVSKRGAAVALAMSGLVAVAFTGPIEAASHNNRYSYERSGDPLLAVVALAEQRITIYDANGKILEAPVSTGQTGYETPAGIYSIVQKKEEHYSNLYDDASMPFMERITWTGIALHAGQLPGYPASHGCVRMPTGFAQDLFSRTQLGMRVIIVREDVTPAEIAQPALFAPSDKSHSAARDSSPAVKTVSAYGGSSAPLYELQTIASDKSLEAESAKARAKEAKLAAGKKNAEAAKAERLVRMAEANLSRAEAELKSLTAALEKATPSSPQAAQLETAKAKAQTKLDNARPQLEMAKSDAQAKKDVARQAEEDLKSATMAANIAADAAEEAKQKLSPISVFISRKAQRLYIRRGNMPVFEAPVLIRDANSPIGSFVFTALDTDSSGQMRWNVVSMYKDPLNVEPPAEAAGKRAKQRRVPVMADVAAAQAAIDRIEVTDEAREHLASVILPGSSLIISDEAASRETGKDTDFIVVMSGEPQGGLAIREPKPRRRSFEDDDFFWGYSREPRRGGGFPFFFD